MSINKLIEKKLKSFAYFFLKLKFKNQEISYPISSEGIKNILILRYDVIGDMIITLPLIDLIKRKIPNVNIYVIASKSNQSILKNETNVTKYYVHDGTKQSLQKVKEETSKIHFDLVLPLVYNKTTKAGYLANYLTNKDAIKVTMEHLERKELYKTFFNIQVTLQDCKEQMTMLEMIVVLVNRLFNWEKEDLIYNVKVSESNITVANEFIELNNITKFIILNISAGKDFRVLSIEKNIEIIKYIKNVLSDYPIILISSKEDIEKAKAIQSVFLDLFYFEPTNDILDAAALIQKASLVISPDTSIVHLAAAAKVPILVLYSLLASYAKEWLPYNSVYEAVITKQREELEKLELNDIFEKLDILINRINL
jgi:ADP-heptose:LPS heptosyltransferase